MNFTNNSTKNFNKNAETKDGVKRKKCQDKENDSFGQVDHI